MSKVNIEKTANPAIIKFVFDRILTENSFEYKSIEDASNSTLVQQLFHLPFVKNVFVTANFIAIEKYDILEWSEVQKEIKEIFEDYMSQNTSIFVENKESNLIGVYAESTPNPNVQKFVTNKLLSNTNIELSNKADAKDVPLALELFDFPFIKEIFISDNYVSIQKNNDLDWFEVNTTIRDFIKEYLQSDRRIVAENYQQKTEIKKEDNNEDLSKYEPTNDDVSKEIIAVLEEYIKPAVAG